MSLSATIQGRLRWIADDVNDKPSVAVAYWDFLKVAARCRHTSETWKDFKLSTLGITSATSDYEPYPPTITGDTPDGTEGDQMGGIATETYRGKLLILRNPTQKSIIPLPSVSGKASGSSNGAAVGIPGVGEVEMYRYSLPIVMGMQVRRRNSGDDYATTSTVAAGGLGDKDEYVADVRVVFTLDGEHNYSPLDIEWQHAELQQILSSLKPKLIRGNGAKVEAKFESGTDPDPIPPSNSIYLGKFTSSDRDLFSESVQLELPLVVANNPEDGDGQLHPRPVVLVNQKWANVEWKMGANGDKTYSPDFIVADDDYTETIWTKVTTLNGKLLKGHTMKFKCSHLVVSEEDPDTGEIVTKTFTTDPHETADHFTYREDIDDLIGSYLTIPSAQESGDGIYKGQLTIKHSEDFVVESYQLALQDQGVWQSKN